MIGKHKSGFRKSQGILELNEELKIHKNQIKIEKEFGDVLFLINYARFIDIDP